ncbi:MAG: sugar transporter [Flavobacteriales bacterium]|jgi:DsbC/DsbD-like thiol-disulfide interchange protein|nr:sugar transporter [Flavobacteriales bacterium]MBK6883530.1 sugar transporter [Flavobacteriales bacterium]MBK7102300.1 sugar transporter [Flavobacteriales bacterium]MBK7113038.1 sugar transporter [Flavobacteriales bacterium]MBK7482964.1 sugar transporter [Flavobacteriales bacterium]
MHLSILITLLTGLLTPAPIVQWHFVVQPAGTGAVQVELEARTVEGWHIYATKLENDLGPIPTAIRFTPSEAYSLLGPLVEPDPVEVYDPNFEMNVRYHEGSPRFVQRIEPTTKEPFVVKGEVEFMVCNDKTCLPPEVVTFTIDVPAVTGKP